MRISITLLLTHSVTGVTATGAVRRLRLILGILLLGTMLACCCSSPEQWQRPARGRLRRSWRGRGSSVRRRLQRLSARCSPTAWSMSPSCPWPRPVQAALPSKVCIFHVCPSKFRKCYESGIDLATASFWMCTAQSAESPLSQFGSIAVSVTEQESKKGLKCTSVLPTPGGKARLLHIFALHGEWVRWVDAPGGPTPSGLGALRMNT